MIKYFPVSYLVVTIVVASCSFERSIDITHPLPSEGKLFYVEARNTRDGLSAGSFGNIMLIHKNERLFITNDDQYYKGPVYCDGRLYYETKPVSETRRSGLTSLSYIEMLDVKTGSRLQVDDVVGNVLSSTSPSCYSNGSVHIVSWFRKNRGSLVYDLVVNYNNDIVAIEIPDGTASPSKPMWSYGGDYIVFAYSRGMGQQIAIYNFRTRQYAHENALHNTVDLVGSNLSSKYQYCRLASLSALGDDVFLYCKKALLDTIFIYRVSMDSAVATPYAEIKGPGVGQFLRGVAVDDVSNVIILLVEAEGGGQDLFALRLGADSAIRITADGRQKSDLHWASSGVP